MVYITRDKDRKIIKNIQDEKIADFIFMHLRNMWAVDGLYFLFIEEKFGTEEATEIDSMVWNAMGKIEAKRIRKFFNIKENDINSFMKALEYSGWAMDLEDKETSIENSIGIIRNKKCRVQNTRLSKGLSEFGCKPVRYNFLKSFAKEFNPNIEVTCNVCPPDEHSKDLWCEWEFKIKGK